MVGAVMSEEQIVERVARAIDEHYDLLIGAFKPHDAARAVLALLGPAPLVWEDGDRVFECVSGRYWVSNRNGFEVWGLDPKDGVGYCLGTEDTLDAAQAVAEAHHQAQWFAGTVLGQEDGA